MAPPPSRSRASSIASADTTTSQNAAFLGANLAFLGRSAPKPVPSAASHIAISTTYQYSGGENGALAAATRADDRSRSPNRSAVSVSRSPHPLPGSLSVRSGRSDAMREREEKEMTMDGNNKPHLAPPSQQARLTHSKSPSHQAAILAAARAPPPSVPPSEKQRGRPRVGTVSKPPPPVAPKPRRLSEHYARSSATDNDDKPTDTTPIAPTTSLVDLFEQKLKGSDKQEKRPDPIVIKPSGDLALKSPTPVRSGGITSMLRLQLEEDKNRSASKDVDTDPVNPSQTASKDEGPSSDDSFASASEALSPRSPPTSPPGVIPRRTSHPTHTSPGQALKVENEARRRPAMSPSPLRPSSSRPIEIRPPKRTGTAQSDALSVSSSHSLKTIPAQFNQAYPRRMTPLTTGDELANALVASSLASSRAPSPMKEAPPVPTRKKKSHHNKLGFSRTPSPAKTGMLKTLRKPQDEDSSSEEEHENEQHPYGHHRKKRLIRKHPNKHHEGDRKRWRDAVTERERKRYEGVWAANKGLHHTFTFEEQQYFRRAPNHPQTQEKKSTANDQVSNIVARDIWNRSRLPDNVLEMVWDLVDNDCVGRLHKEEFVVGMWLIDQRLKGRKLPTKVTDSVWASVRGISGIKVKVKK